MEKIVSKATKELLKDFDPEQFVLYLLERLQFISKLEREKYQKEIEDILLVLALINALIKADDEDDDEKFEAAAEKISQKASEIQDDDLHGKLVGPLAVQVFFINFFVFEDLFNMLRVPYWKWETLGLIIESLLEAFEEEPDDYEDELVQSLPQLRELMPQIAVMLRGGQVGSACNVANQLTHDFLRHLVQRVLVIASLFDDPDNVTRVWELAQAAASYVDDEGESYTSLIHHLLNQERSEEALSLIRKIPNPISRAKMFFYVALYAPQRYAVEEAWKSVVDLEDSQIKSDFLVDLVGMLSHTAGCSDVPTLLSQIDDPITRGRARKLLNPRSTRRK